MGPIQTRKEVPRPLWAFVPRSDPAVAVKQDGQRAARGEIEPRETMSSGGYPVLPEMLEGVLLAHPCSGLGISPVVLRAVLQPQTGLSAHKCWF